jgi:hypothetical protein
MFIESEETLWVGAGFTAQIGLDSPLKVDCFVRRVEPGRGMGVSVSLSEEFHQRRYNELIRTLSGRPN